MIRVDATRNLTILKAFALVLLPMAACTVTTTDKGSGAAGADSGGSGGDVSSGGSPSDGGSSAAGRAGSQPSGAGAAQGGMAGTVDAGAAGTAEAGMGGTAEAGMAGTAGSAGSGPEPGCIRSVNSEVVVRGDGLAVHEGPPEKVVIDAASGTMNTPLADVVAVQQQAYASCAIVKGGRVACWQNDAAKGNLYGQLGNGSLNPAALYRASPVLTAADTPLTKVVSLASGWNSNATCAVTSDGKLWCWGALNWIVNNGTQLYSPYAQTVMGPDGQSPLTGVIQATVAYEQGCALVGGSPNTVWCWGTALTGELGQGDTKNHQYPVQVPSLTNPSKVVLSYGGYYAGYNYATACALDGGAVECWGTNNNGATGSSGANPVLAPTLVTTSTGSVLRGIVDLIEGQNGFAVLRNDATIWTWGAPAGNTAYAKAYGVPNVSQVAWAGGGGLPIRYLTTDGVYHSAMSVIDVNCGSFD